MEEIKRNPEARCPIYPTEGKLLLSRHTGHIPNIRYCVIKQIKCISDL